MLEELKDIIANIPDHEAIYVCSYDYGDSEHRVYLNCENQFCSEDDNTWCDMDLVDNYFHSFRSLKDIRLMIETIEIIELSKSMGFYTLGFASSTDHRVLCRRVASL